MVGGLRVWRIDFLSLVENCYTLVQLVRINNVELLSTLITFKKILDTLRKLIYYVIHHLFKVRLSIL